jgi:SAM-dependent methyltransferase
MPPKGAHEPPPQAILIQALMGKFVSKSVSVAADFGFADVLAHEGPLPAETIASHAGTDPDATGRLLRALAAVGVFAQVGERVFANNAVSECLRSDIKGSQRPMARWFNCPTGWEAWSALAHSVKTGAAASEHLFGHNLFEYLHTQRPEDANHFDQAMTSFSHMTAGAVADAYDFAPFTRLVDVGGGHGLLLTTVVARYPNLAGVLFDLPTVVEAAAGLVAASGVGDRVERVGGDFFAGVPEGGDCYMMKAIIHDWDDERASRILANCARALRPGGKVLVLDQVLGDGPESTFAKLLDLEMLVMTTGGRERTAGELERLFARSGLLVTRIVPTEGPVSVIEGVVA